MMTRTRLIEKLSGLVEVTFGQLRFRFPGAAGDVDEKGAVKPRVGQLVAWAESTTGPGLQAILKAAHDLWPIPFPDTDLDDDKIKSEFNPRCPYPGMLSFESSTGFYGRRDLTDQILGKVINAPLVLVHGASGSGKSSVVRAGVFAEWEKQHGDRTVFTVKLEENPFEAIYVIVAGRFSIKKAEPFRRPSRDAFSQLASLLAAEGIRQPLIFVDTFEKLFASESDSAKKLRGDFVASLVEFAMHNDSGARIILGMRDDFLGFLNKYLDLCQYTEAHRVPVLPMDEDSLRMAIQRPAADHGVTLEPEIAEDIVTRVLGRNGMLPLMQNVLQQVWTDQEKTDLATTHKLAMDTYIKRGRVIGSLTNYLDALCREKGEANLRRIFLRTIQVTADQTTPTISRRGRRSELSSADQPIIDQLIDDKVLVGFDPDTGQSEGRFGLPHEAVIQNWSTLKDWIKDYRPILTLLIRLNEDVVDRQRELTAHPDEVAEIDQEYLWRGGRLVELTKLAISDFEQLGFTREMRGFLDASQKQEQKERDRELRLAREKAETARKHTLIAFGLMAIALCFGYGMYKANQKNLVQLHTASMADHASARKAWDENDSAERERRWAPSIGYASKWHEAVALWARALELEPTNAQASYWLYDTLLHHGHGQANSPFRMLPHDDEVLVSSYSPDGTRIVVAGKGNTAQIWDAETGKFVCSLLGHKHQIVSASFSPDGTRVATSSWDETACVWDAVTGQRLVKPLNHKGIVSCVSFCPDGARVVTASADYTAQIWDSATGEPLGTLQHGDSVRSASFSPDGTRVITAIEGNTAHVWNAATREKFCQPLQHDGGVHIASFSPDGARVVTASADRTARVWDAATGKKLCEPLGHVESVLTASFSPDGARVVTACEDSTARVWDAATGKQLGEPLRHEGIVHIASFSPDGRWIITASHDMAFVWDVDTQARLSGPFRQESRVVSASFNPDGTRFVTASYKNVRIWEMATNTPLDIPFRHASDVNGASFCMDGTRIVTASGIYASVWDVNSGKRVKRSLPHGASINDAHFNPDGKRIVTACNDKHAYVWDMATYDLLKMLPHKSMVRSAYFSPDGALIITTGDDNRTYGWDANTYVTEGELSHNALAPKANDSPDGERIIKTASRSDSAQVCDATGILLGEPLRHGHSVSTLSFSPTGKQVITASSDYTVAKLWGVPTAEESQKIAQITPTVLTWVRVEAGLRFNKNGELELIPNDEWSAMLEEVKLPPGPWAELATWLKLSGPQRTVSPRSNVTLRQIAERERDFGPLNVGDKASLESSLKYDTTVPLARMMLAKLLVDEEQAKEESTRDAKVAARAAHWRQYDLDRLEPLKDSKLWQQAADILRQSPPDAPVGVGPKATTVKQSIEHAEKKAKQLTSPVTSVQP